MGRCCYSTGGLGDWGPCIVELVIVVVKIYKHRQLLWAAMPKTMTHAALVRQAEQRKLAVLRQVGASWAALYGHWS
eukprot:COSAG01_NODE_4893_length_4645_cov_132.805983_5_plen_76_part_00